ncbi:MAG: glycoside hydrolase family 3 C-terminal domain-containing protein [Breznakibacter sp.]
MPKYKRKQLIYPLLLAALFFACSKEIYKNSSLPAGKRAEDLVSRLTLEEKVMLMQDASKPVERLGIKTYNWWNEALHGVARAGNATVFPQPIGMAATFDRDAVLHVFNAVSDEARAKHTFFSSQGTYERYQGLTMWTPTINIFRDPRWGRGMESYGEDPYLTSILGVAVVKGLQGPPNNKYDKIHACAKHFAVHSGPEWNRHSFDAKAIKPRDLYETYLPAFEALVKDANVKEVMCAYNRFEGEPCCGSNQLLIHILRNQWNFDGIVVADCGAIADFYKPNAHATHADAATASAAAVLSGTDLDCGSSYKSLTESVKNGYISEKDIDVSVKRLMKARFELGEMDTHNEVGWTKIPYSVVCSSAHDSIALGIARKSMTLLQNKDSFLPLKRGGLTVAVMGPNANDSLMQWGNYNGTPQQTITILEGIRSALGPTDKLIYEQGCEWVEKTLVTSAFNQCTSAAGPGFTARYWNNLDRSGNPDASTLVSTPFRFCTSGATVFAPGVNLTDFSASYQSVFNPTRSGEVVFQFYSCGSTQLKINGNEVAGFVNKHGSRRQEYKMVVQAGQTYNIDIDFAFTRNDAELNFNLGYKEDIDIARSVEKVKDADVVVFVSGISPFLEGEEMGVNQPGFKRGDRTTIELPDVQRELISALGRAGKKIVLVNCSGSAIAIEPETLICESILQAWYPGQSGGKAVAEVLFGDFNPAGRLPVTFYKSTDQLPDFEDYQMANRTYRYFRDEPLFRFGHGLSYTVFEYGAPSLDKTSIANGEAATLTVPVTNTGKYNGEEVVQVYLKKEGDVDGPNLTLRAFERVTIPVGATIDVKFELTGKNMEWWNSDSQKVMFTPGEYILLVGGTSDMQRLTPLKIVLK